MPTSVSGSPPRYDAPQFHIRFSSAPEAAGQDEESFEFDHRGSRRQLRIHDYAEIFRVPGLYEALVYGTLRCDSPRRLTVLMQNVLTDWPDGPADLRVLDLGAGNGIMAEELRRVGVGEVVGLDLLPEAAMAARRDRPDVYDDFVVADLTSLSEVDQQRLERARLNCLVTVAALGFGDIPPSAFATAFNAIESEGWLAMTIKENFLDPHTDDSGFSSLLRSLVEAGTIELQAQLRFCHRLSIEGEQLFYLAVVARKTADIGRSHPRRSGAHAAVLNRKPSATKASAAPASNGWANR